MPHVDAYPLSEVRMDARNERHKGATPAFALCIAALEARKEEG